MKYVQPVIKAINSFIMSFKRFPVTIVLSASATALLIIISEISPDIDKSTADLLTRILLTLVLGIPVSACIKLVFEKLGYIKPAAVIVTYICMAAFLALYCIFLLSEFRMVPITRYIAVNLAFYLIFFIIPYFYRKELFEIYVIKLFVRFFVTAIYSAVLFAGLSAIYFTIDKLLGISVPEKLYYYTWLAIVGLFASIFFLAGIPHHGYSYVTGDYPKFFRILLQYIVMPLIAIYTAILYIYFIKIIVTHQWPQGLVTHLVLWYSVVTTGVMFFISPIADENKWSRWFIFWLSKLIIPLIAMMFVSIGIRINAYGITENRYFVVVLGLWVLGMMIYLSVARKKRNIILPISLAIISILSVFGPWSSYSVSKASQNARFASILKSNSMLVNGEIKKAPENISDKDKVEISEIIRYFNRNHSLRDIKYLPADFKIDDMPELFGFSYQERWGSIEQPQYFSYFYKEQEHVLDIKGYDYMIELNNYNSSTIKYEDLQVSYDADTTNISISYGGNVIYTNRLDTFAAKIHDKFANNNKYEVDAEDMTFTDENDNVSLKLIFKNIFGQQDEYGSGKIKIRDFNLYLLIKLK